MSDYLCSAVEKMSCCITDVTSDCTDHDSILAVSSLYHEVYAIVGEKCPPRDINARVAKNCPMRLPKRCEVMNAVNKCLLYIGSQADKRQICRYVMKTYYYSQYCISIFQITELAF